MTDRTSGDSVTKVMQRLLIVVAATLLALTSGLGIGAGIGTADPYDDEDGTVEVAPDIASEEPQQDVPDVDSPEGVEEPAPADEPAAQPDEPGPAEPDVQGPASDPEPASDEPPSQGSQNDSAPEPAASGSEDGGDDDGAGEVVPDSPLADPGDTKQAQDSTPVVAEARQADDTTITEMRTSVETAMSSSTSLEVTQWSSSWTRYDQYYQPLIANPFRVPIQLAYTYDSLPYVVTIAPLAQSVLNVPKPGVYSFTAVVPNSSGGVANVSVGSFSGGGYVPKPGQPMPSKPPALVSYTNVLVRFDLSGVTYEPIVVKKVVDLGDDPETGTRKVLLDEETPAWGSWGHTDSGKREFTVTSTQSLPGLTAPAASAPPGYKLTATPASAPSSGTSTLAWVAIAFGAVAIIAVIAVVVTVTRRRKPEEV